MEQQSAGQKEQPQSKHASHQELKGEEAKHLLAAILESSYDAIFSQSVDNIILSWSHGAERVYGYTPGEVIGRPVTLLLPPHVTREAEEISRKTARGERIERVESVRVTKDGKHIDVELTVTPITDSTGHIIGGLVVERNITEQRRASNALLELQASSQNRSLVLETANRVAIDILSSRTGVEALRHIADAARILSNARYAALGVARPDGNSLQEFITVGLTPQEEAAIGPRPRGAGVLGMLLQRTEPLRLDVLAEHPAYVGFPANHPPMDSFLGVPIRLNDIVLGSLYLTNKQGGGPFTEADEVAVQALGAHAAVAIRNMHMLTRQRALVSGLITAQEEERRAVAYDLHDGLTQYVMASHAHLEAFRRAHQAHNEQKAARELEAGLRYLKEAVVESRRLINGLRSLALDDLGLAGALEQLVNEEKIRAGWEEADFIHNITEHRFDKTFETGVYRVVQEALTNARKHAATKRVHVLLRQELNEENQAPQLRLEVRDWGHGFNLEERVGDENQVGLQGMIERVRLLNGRFDLQSAPGEGTRVRAIFPVLEPQLQNVSGGATPHEAVSDGIMGRDATGNAMLEKDVDKV